jgi:hypothetical protein
MNCSGSIHTLSVRKKKRRFNRLPPGRIEEKLKPTAKKKAKAKSKRLDCTCSLLSRAVQSVLSRTRGSCQFRESHALSCQTSMYELRVLVCIVLLFSLSTALHVPAFTRGARILKRTRVVAAAESSLATQVAQDLLDLASAGVGGTIGVLGTLGALMLKKREVKDRSECPYCASSGHLTCALCFGGGTLVASAVKSRQTCVNCEATGFVTCVNCKGDGRLIPIILDSSISRDPESELEDIGMA